MRLRISLMAYLSASLLMAADLPSPLKIPELKVPPATVQMLTQHAMEESMRAALSKPLSKRAEQATLLQMAPRVETECAIPLREVKVGDGKKLDPMAKAGLPDKIDPIGRRAPMRVCGAK